ncbi:MAG: hypothetical protein DRQ24_12235 [Candidatus Latescibacterota bacterium]|nr:MAG: hypothetical protein DRQ24_12235 [Candidatus Latescibacterota bacterium]
MESVAEELLDCFGGYGIEYEEEECRACEYERECREVTDLLMGGRIEEAFDVIGEDKKIFMKIAEHYDDLEILEISTMIYEFLVELDSFKPLIERDHVPRGQLYYNYDSLGDKEKAKKYFNEAKEILNKRLRTWRKSPEHIDDFIALGYLLLDEDPKEAERNFESAMIYIKLLLGSVYFGLGEALKNQGKIEKAMEMWKKAMELELEDLHAELRINFYTEFKNPRVWKIAPADYSVWENWSETDLSHLKSEDSMLYYKRDDEFEKELEKFIQDLKPGDVLLAWLGNKIVGMGKVLSKCFRLVGRGHARKVRWIALDKPLELEENCKVYRKMSLNTVIEPLDDVEKDIVSIIKKKCQKILENLRVTWDWKENETAEKI